MRISNGVCPNPNPYPFIHLNLLRFVFDECLYKDAQFKMLQIENTASIVQYSTHVQYIFEKSVLTPLP